MGFFFGSLAAGNPNLDMIKEEGSMNSRIEKIRMDMQEARLAEDLERYRQKALALGASQALVVRAEDIPVDDRVTLKCRIPRCFGYGAGAHCPPHTMKPSELRRSSNNSRGRYSLLVKSLSADFIVRATQQSHLSRRFSANIRTASAARVQKRHYSRQTILEGRLGTVISCCLPWSSRSPRPGHNRRGESGSRLCRASTEARSVRSPFP